MCLTQRHTNGEVGNDEEGKILRRQWFDEEEINEEGWAPALSLCRWATHMVEADEVIIVDCPHNMLCRHTTGRCLLVNIPTSIQPINKCWQSTQMHTKVIPLRVMNQKTQKWRQQRYHIACFDLGLNFYWHRDLNPDFQGVLAKALIVDLAGQAWPFLHHSVFQIMT